MKDDGSDIVMIITHVTVVEVIKYSIIIEYKHYLALTTILHNKLE